MNIEILSKRIKELEEKLVNKKTIIDSQKIQIEE